MVDLIGEGFDAAIRLAVLPDSSLVARRLCEMPRYLVGAPAYLDKHGRPKHPLHLAQHRCIIYSHSMTAETWRFTKDGRPATVRPSGPLRVNNGDAMMPALIAGCGLGILPEFILRDALATGRLERLLPDWSIPVHAQSCGGSARHCVLRRRAPGGVVSAASSRRPLNWAGEAACPPRSRHSEHEFIDKNQGLTNHNEPHLTRRTRPMRVGLGIARPCRGWLQLHDCGSEQ
jgi:DNA-binding transcriptional LysR family regulator